MILIFTCLSGVGDRLGGMRGKALNTQQRAVIGSFGTGKHICFSEVREMPNTKPEELLKCFTTEGAFGRLTNATLPQLIQQLGVNSDDSYENRIRLWFIREKINKKYRGGLHLPGFELFRTTFKPLLDSIRDAKQWADRQPGGSDAVKLCDSFRTVSSEKSSSNYAKVLADMLENSPETWELQPVVPAEEPAIQGRNPFDEKPSSIPSMPPSSHAEATADRFASPNSSSRQDSYRQKNFIPQRPGGISVWTALQARAVANSARGQQAPVVAQRDLVTEMVRKFPLNVYDSSLTVKIQNWLRSQSLQELHDEYRNIPQSLKDFLDSINYMAIETPGFGNCAFDSVLLSLFCLEPLYQPRYNKILGAYLERQIYDFRQFVALNTGDISLKNDIETPNKPVDQNVFSVIAPVLLRKILLIIPHGISDVLIECYSSDPGNPVVERPDYKHGQTNQAFFDSHKDGALIIAFNGFGHYVAVRPK